MSSCKKNCLTPQPCATVNLRVNAPEAILSWCPPMIPKTANRKARAKAHQATMACFAAGLASLPPTQQEGGHSCPPHVCLPARIQGGRNAPSPFHSIRAGNNCPIDGPGVCENSGLASLGSRGSVLALGSRGSVLALCPGGGFAGWLKARVRSPAGPGRDLSGFIARVGLRATAPIACAVRCRRGLGCH